MQVIERVIVFCGRALDEYDDFFSNSSVTGCTVNKALNTLFMTSFEAAIVP